MAAIAFAVPIVPGQENAFRSFLQEMGGARREDYLRTRERQGITREVVWQQQTPEGGMAIVYLEADDIEGFFRDAATANDPFGQWFREKVQSVHGFDLSQPIPGGLPEMVFDGPMP